MTRSLRSKNWQNGSTLIEMVISMPIILLAGFSILDIWHYVTEKQIAVETARAGGRWAVATQMQTDTALQSSGFPMSCKTAINLELNNNQAGQESTSALDLRTANYSCKYLQASGLDLENWQVNPVISEGTSIADGVIVQTIEVEIFQEKSRCLGCLRQIALSPVHARARYNLPFPTINDTVS